MANQNYDSLIGSFLRSLLPPEVERDYRLLAALEYPIPDKRTFEERIERSGTDRNDVDRLADLFEPEDFGLDTAQSGFEKFHKRSRHFSLPGVPLPRTALQALADVVAAGGLSIRGADLVLRSRIGGAIEVDCLCLDGGGCEIVLVGSQLICRSKGCNENCSWSIVIPLPELTGGFEPPSQL